MKNESLKTEGKRERRRRKKGCSETRQLLYGEGEVKTFTALKALRQCPLVLLVHVNWQQGALASGAGNVMGSELLGEELRIVLQGRQCDKMCNRVGRTAFGKKLLN
jgi:hypothetical protein